MIQQIIAFIDLNKQMTTGLNWKSAANIYSSVSQPGFRGILGVPWASLKVSATSFNGYIFFGKEVIIDLYAIISGDKLSNIGSYGSF
jgi:hypothetical protein